MKKLLIIAIAGLLFASCEKDEKEKTESDIIVKEYGEDYADLCQGDTIYLDLNDDRDNDIMVWVLHSSDLNPYKCFKPMRSDVAVGGLMYEDNLHYGDMICDTLFLYADRIAWQQSGPMSNRYLAIKFQTDTSVNYGWILPLVEQHSNDEQYQTLTIQKTGYCKTNGKTIFAGQEE